MQANNKTFAIKVDSDQAAHTWYCISLFSESQQLITNGRPLFFSFGSDWMNQQLYEQGVNSDGLIDCFVFNKFKFKFKFIYSAYKVILHRRTEQNRTLFKNIDLNTYGSSSTYNIFKHTWVWTYKLNVDKYTVFNTLFSWKYE